MGVCGQGQPTAWNPHNIYQNKDRAAPHQDPMHALSTVRQPVNRYDANHASIVVSKESLHERLDSPYLPARNLWVGTQHLCPINELGAHESLKILCNNPLQACRLEADVALLGQCMYIGHRSNGTESYVVNDYNERRNDFDTLVQLQTTPAPEHQI